MLSRDFCVVTDLSGNAFSVPSLRIMYALNFW